MVNPKLIWMGSLFNLFSGGDTVSGFMYAVVLTDVTPREQLSKTFLYVTASLVACFMLGPLISASLMKINDWFPLWIGLLMQLLFVLFTCYLPETLHKANDSSIQTNHQTANRSADNFSDTPDTPQTHDFEQLRTLISTSIADIRCVFGDWRIAFLACLFPVRQMSMSLEDLQSRYVSYRYHWTIANATYLYALQGFGALIMLLFVLPRFADLLRTRWHLTPIQSAALLLEISLCFSILGSAMEGNAPTISILIIGAMIQTLAIGSPAALRALAGSLVGSEDTGKVFTGLAIVETLSGMASGPIIAGLYNAGIDRGGGAWLGLPYDVTALVKGALTVTMCMITFER